MKLNKFLLVTALSLFAASGLMATQQSKEEVPGVAAQPASYFYTGKPYDADLGEFTFNYRNYNPEMKRWTSADPCGFPDGANNRIYAPKPTHGVDPTGLCDYCYEDETRRVLQGDWAASNINYDCRNLTTPGHVLIYGGSCDWTAQVNTLDRCSTHGNLAAFGTMKISVNFSLGVPLDCSAPLNGGVASLLSTFTLTEAIANATSNFVIPNMAILTPEHARTLQACINQSKPTGFANGVWINYFDPCE